MVDNAHNPTPDAKDWTWVLDERCEECDLDLSAVERRELGPLFRSNAATWRTLLARDGLVAKRPIIDGETRWSALEYGAHVRDVYELFRERVTVMLKKDNPTFSNWDQDVVAIDKKYGEQDANKVAYDLAVNAGRLADVYERIHADEWGREGTRSDGKTFTVESIGLYALHDVTHHVVDVEAGYAALTST